MARTFEVEEEARKEVPIKLAIRGCLSGNYSTALQLLRLQMGKIGRNLRLGPLRDHRINGGDLDVLSGNRLLFSELIHEIGLKFNNY